MNLFFWRLVCLAIGHRTLSYGQIMSIATSSADWVPATRALCTRCRWRGYRTTWGMLISAAK